MFISIKFPAIIFIAAMLAVTVFCGTAMAVSPDEPVAGYSPVTAAQLEAELSSRNPGHIHPNIAQLYVDWGYRFGIRADVAFAQMLHETNFLRYGGDVSPSQNNFAGIGATGGGNPGNSFATPELGVVAHYAHLAWYVFPNHVNGYCNSSFDPRHFGTTHRNTVHIIRDLAGQWAVPGTGYAEALARYATEIWRYGAGGRLLGSFNEVAGVPVSHLSLTWYFPWYDAKPENGMQGNWIVIGNQGTGTARVQLFIGGAQTIAPGGNDYWTIPEGGLITPSFSGFMGGPVKIVSLDGQPLIASQRVLFRDSFNEVTGITGEELSDSQEFTWYDSLPENGMAGNWILIANAGSQAADVNVYLGGNLAAQYSAAGGNALVPGGIVTPQFTRSITGPVLVVSTNGQPLIASQRVLYKDSFNEVTGVPSASLGSEYLFSWYDLVRAGGMNGDWILIANRDVQPADVEIYLGSTLLARYSAAGSNPIPPGGIVTPSFEGRMGGPVRVVSTNASKLMVSQRVVFKDSFEEIQGFSPADIGDDLALTWYDSTLIDYMRGDWILVANRGSGEARVEIWVGGSRMHDPSNPGNDYFTVPEGGIITPQFANFMGGPIRVISTTGQQLLVSQRVLYKDGLSR